MTRKTLRGFLPAFGELTRHLTLRDCSALQRLNIVEGCSGHACRVEPQKYNVTHRRDVET